MNQLSKERLLPPLWVLTTALIVLIFWLIFQLKEIVVLLVLGYCVAYVMDPFLDWMERRKISRGVGIFVLFGVLLILLTLLIGTAIPAILAEIDALQDNFPHYVDTLSKKFLPVFDYLQRKFPEQFSEFQSFDKVISSVGVDGITNISNKVFDALLKGYSITLTIVNLVLLPFIVYYLALDLDRFHRATLFLFPVTVRDKVYRIVGEMNGFISAFVRGQLLVSFILFIMYAISLYILGVQLWFTLAVLSGFGNIIPYFGFLIGIVLSSIMTLITFADFTHLLYLWAIYVVIQLIESNFITPKIIGQKVGISPLVVILAIFSAGKLFGLLGVFLAVPLAAVLKVLVKEGHRWLISRYQPVALS